jgi:hypothetical protein
MEPGVKGTIFSNVASELYELLAEGKLREEQFAALIKPDEREILDRELSISAWYPADLYGRMLQLYAQASPGSGREFLIESGRRSARKVIELGIYAQLDGPHRGGVGESHRTHSR